MHYFEFIFFLPILRHPKGISYRFFSNLFVCTIHNGNDTVCSTRSHHTNDWRICSEKRKWKGNKKKCKKKTTNFFIRMAWDAHYFNERWHKCNDDNKIYKTKWNNERINHIVLLHPCMCRFTSNFEIIIEGDRIGIWNSLSLWIVFHLKIEKKKNCFLLNVD